jgi:TRAP-type C4-dicarboxylate transport system permease small subunit
MTKWLELVLRTIGAGALLVLFALIVMQVVLRYGFGYTPFFTEEIARYSLVWSVLCGTAVSILIDGHIRVTFVPDMLGEKVRWLWLRGLDLISLAMLLILTVAAVQSVEFASGQTSDGLQVPLQYPYLALPAAFGAGLYFLVVRVCRAWDGRPWKNGGSAAT